MAGRRLASEPELLRKGYTRADFVRRREVLRETLEAFETADPKDKYQQLAAANLHRWKNQSVGERPVGHVQVVAGDWGAVTQALTMRHGACFAVLNMANAYVPGGAYVEGAPAQEENIFRRTDCHFHVRSTEYDEAMDSYRPEMTDLINAANGSVYLDTKRPRTCIRGPEDRTRENLGYRWLASDEIFPFYELRAAAQDLRDGSGFDPDEARRRIAAQLDTLVHGGVDHAVLGASGCGAFRNPPREVAQIYKEEIHSRRNDFAVIAFAILSAGYGPDNAKYFLDAFAG